MSHRPLARAQARVVDVSFLKLILDVVDVLKDVLGNVGDASFTLSVQAAITFIKKVDTVETVKVKDISTYEKKRAKELLASVSEVLVDWALFYELEKQEAKP